MRVLILGNSHVAAVKSAHAAAQGAPAPRWSGLDCAFAGAHGDALARMSVDAAGVLRPDTKEVARNVERLNGCSSFDLGAHDAFLVVGCELSIFRVVQLYRGLVYAGLPSMQGRALPEASRLQPVSRALFRAGVVSALGETLAMVLARRLRAGLDAQGRAAVPVLIAAQPHPAWDCRAVAGNFKGLLRAERRGDANALHRMFEEAAQLALEGTAHFLPQPEITRRAGIFTRPRYASGSVRLTRAMKLAHPVTDYLHANADYGALVLEQLAGALLGEPAA